MLTGRKPARAVQIERLGPLTGRGMELVGAPGINADTTIGKRNCRGRREDESNGRGRNAFHQSASQWHPLHSAAVIDGNADPTGHSSRGYWRGKSGSRGP